MEPNLDYNILIKRGEAKVGPGIVGSIRVSVDDDDIAYLKAEFADQLAKGEILLLEDSHELWVPEIDKDVWTRFLGIPLVSEKMDSSDKVEPVVIENVEVNGKDLLL